MEAARIEPAGRGLTDLPGHQPTPTICLLTLTRGTVKCPKSIEAYTKKRTSDNAGSWTFEIRADWIRTSDSPVPQTGALTRLRYGPMPFYNVFRTLLSERYTKCMPSWLFRTVVDA